MSDYKTPSEMGHVIRTTKTCTCNKDEDGRRCPTCDWGLSVCVLCGKAEIELSLPCTSERRPRWTTTKLESNVDE